MSSETRNKLLGCLFGGAVGDTFGGPYEFKLRDSYEITENMEYNGNFGLKAGSYTDDTSTMLCLLMSLLECNGFDNMDQIEKYEQTKTHCLTTCQRFRNH